MVLLVMLTIGLIFGIPMMIVFVWPAYFYNIRRFIRVMRYWAGKERYIAKVQEAKFVKNIPPPPPRILLDRRPPYRMREADRYR